MATWNRTFCSVGAYLGRRAMLQGGTLWLASASLGLKTLAADSVSESSAPPALRVGLLTDLHYADKPPAGTRHYRDTLEKFRVASTRYQEHPPAFVVELGDLIDAADSVDLEQRYLETINTELKKAVGDRHYVLGNHCVDTLTKQEFLQGVGQERSYYSFDRSGFHFVVLDSCFRSDGEPYGRRNFHWTDANVPAAELSWLAADLKQTQLPTIVFAHQRLDVSDQHGVKNQTEVRRILESAEGVLAVFQGHSHQNDYKEIRGIHYCTLRAMVEGSGAENNGFSVLEIAADGSLRLEGFGRQESYRWPNA